MAYALADRRLRLDPAAQTRDVNVSTLWRKRYRIN
jgi:hypothetical protein